MIPQTTQIHKYNITYLHKEELKNLRKEIFQNRIYDIDLETDTPLIFDVGAHIGLATIFFKDIYPESNIVAFEPNPNIHHIFEENISINNLQNITLHKAALGRKETEKELYIDSSGGGHFSTASFIKNAWNGKQKSIGIKVKVEKLSEYIKEDIDLLKIDTEGNELEILENLDENNKFKSIRNLIVEYHPDPKKPLNKIITILERNGYEIDRKEIDREDGLVLVVAKKISKNS